MVVQSSVLWRTQYADSSANTTRLGSFNKSKNKQIQVNNIMQIHNKIAKDLNSILGKKFDKLSIANEQALSTIDPSSGRIFTLEYTGSGKTYGSVTVNIVDPSALVVYYNNNISEDMEYDDKKSWYGFLKELRYFAKRNLMGFDVRNIGKQQLDKKDYAFIKTNHTSINADEVTESKMHGSLRTSYQNIGEVRLVVKHRKPVDEEKRGARTRQIHSLYIEDNSKQRTKMPYNYLAGARALAQHVNQGGVFEDEFGQHIIDMVQEVVDLKKFVKSFRRADNFAEQDDATRIIEQARDRAIGLNSTLKTLSGPKGYTGYVEQYEPTQENIEQADLDDIRSKLIRIERDNIVDSVLPSLARGIKAMNIKEQEMLSQVAGDADAEITVYPNSEEDKDIRDYISYVKNVVSKRKTSEDPMDGIVSRVIMTLTKRATDDELARELGRLDMRDMTQKKIAYQLAGKYLKGKVKVVEPKAKKHIKKTEDAQLEDWATNVVEGTWAIPDTEEAVSEIEELMKEPLPLGPGGEDATNAIGGAIGDDTLFDDLGDAGDKDPNADARPIIADWIISNIGSYSGMPAELASKLVGIAKSGSTESNPQMELPLGEEDMNEAIPYMYKLQQDGKSVEEIAKELNMTVDAVKAAMSKQHADEDVDVEFNEAVHALKTLAFGEGYEGYEDAANVKATPAPSGYIEMSGFKDERKAQGMDDDGIKQEIMQWLRSEDGMGIMFTDRYLKGGVMDMIEAGFADDDYTFDDLVDDLKKSVTEDFDSGHADHSNMVQNDMNKDSVMDIIKKHPAEAKKMMQAGDVFSIYGGDLYNELFDYMSSESGTYMGSSDVDPVEELNDMLDSFSLLDLPDSAMEDDTDLRQRMLHLAGLN